jgi:hypothetical protein
MRAQGQRIWDLAGVRPQPHHARAALFFLPNFAIAKAAIYLIPLAVAALAPPAIYGGFELALSIGLLFATIATGPSLSGLSQMYLVRGERRFADQVWLVLLAGCCLALLLGAIALVGVSDPMVFLVAASLGIAVLHYGGAQALRTLSRRNLVAWADGASVIVSGAVVVALLLLFGQPSLNQLGWGYYLVAAAGALIAGVMLVRTRQPQLLARLRTATRIGLPITIAAVFAFWLAVGGRIVVGLTNETALPVYGVAFRLAGLALGIHQLASTAMFARLYAARTREADRLFSFFFSAVGLLSAFIAIAGAVLPGLVPIAAIDAASPALFRTVLALAALQTFFWIGFALLQLRINRAGLARRALRPTVLVTGAGIAATFAIAWLTAGNLIAISWAIALHGAAYFFAYAYLLAQKGIPHRRTTVVGAAGGVALALIALAVA